MAKHKRFVLLWLSRPNQTNAPPLTVRALTASATCRTATVQPGLKVWHERGREATDCMMQQAPMAMASEITPSVCLSPCILMAVCAIMHQQEIILAGMPNRSPTPIIMDAHAAYSQDWNAWL